MCRCLELQGQSSAQVKVVIDQFVFGNVATVPLADTTPAFSKLGRRRARDQNFTAISAANPAKRGQIVQLYMNGLGPLDTQPATGEPAPASRSPTRRTRPR